MFLQRVMVETNLSKKCGKASGSAVSKRSQNALIKEAHYRL
jgi:hypothetical protein